MIGVMALPAHTFWSSVPAAEVRSMHAIWEKILFVENKKTEKRTRILIYLIRYYFIK